MTTPVEISTTILGGLPVIVQAQIAPSEPDVGIFQPHPDGYQIFWFGKKLREVPESVYARISKREEDLLCEQIMEGYYEDR